MLLPEWASAQSSLLVGGSSGLRPTQGLTRHGRLFVEKNRVFPIWTAKKGRNLDKNLGGRVFLEKNSVSRFGGPKKAENSREKSWEFIC